MDNPSRMTTRFVLRVNTHVLKYVPRFVCTGQLGRGRVSKRAPQSKM